MLIKEGQTLERKDGSVVDAEDEIRRFCVTTVETVLTLFATNRKEWQKFVEAFEKSKKAASWCAIEAAANADAAEDLFVGMREVEHE